MDIYKDIWAAVVEHLQSDPAAILRLAQTSWQMYCLIHRESTINIICFVMKYLHEYPIDLLKLARVCKVLNTTINKILPSIFSNNTDINMTYFDRNNGNMNTRKISPQTRDLFERVDIHETHFITISWVCRRLLISIWRTNNDTKIVVTIDNGSLKTNKYAMYLGDINRICWSSGSISIVEFIERMFPGLVIIHR